jgi:membrane protein required for beta-lactamase induction
MASSNTHNAFEGDAELKRELSSLAKHRLSASRIGNITKLALKHVKVGALFRAVVVLYCDSHCVVMSPHVLLVLQTRSVYHRALLQSVQHGFETISIVCVVLYCAGSRTFRTSIRTYCDTVVLHVQLTQCCGADM